MSHIIASLKGDTKPLGLSPSFLIELFWENSSYVSGLGVCIFVASYVRMFVAGTDKVEGTMSFCVRTNEILASNR